MATELEAAKKARSYLKQRLTTLEKSVAKYTVENVPQAKYESLEATFSEISSKLDENFQALVNLEQSANLGEIEKQYQDMTDRIEDLDVFVSKCHDRFRAERHQEEEQLRREQAQTEKELELARIQAGINTAAQPQPAPVTQRPKLPQLALPTFNGKYDEWLPFRDRFNQTVHKRTDISGAEKFSYLLAALKGSAHDSIKTIPINDTNYQTAYDRLTKLFQHTREIAYSIVDRVLDEKPIGSRTQETLLATSNLMSNVTASLHSVDSTVNIADLLLLRITARILDAQTMERFHQTLADNNIPTFQALLDFVDKEMLLINNPPTTTVTTGSYQKSNYNQRSNTQSDTAKSKQSTNRKCMICSEDHPHYRCSKLSETAEVDRKKLVEKAKLCINCLGTGHGYKACKSTRACKTCNQKHHSLLHSSFANPTPAKAASHSTTAAPDNVIELKLKPTAVVNVDNHKGDKIPCRALIDNCSDMSFIQESLVRILGLTPVKQAFKTQITALQNVQVSNVSEFVVLKLTSMHPPYAVYDVQAFIIKKVGGSYPSSHLKPDSWSHINRVQDCLADPEFATARRVELLLATDIYHDIIKGSVLRGTPGQPVAIESSLGWLIGGGTNTQPQQQSHCNLTDTVEETLQKFFEIEQGPCEKKLFTAEEQASERHYDETTTRLVSGTYRVELPFKPSAAPLGNSRGMATKRFYALESKLKRNPKLSTAYHKSIQDLLADGHAEPVPNHELKKPDDICYYLPHHAVFKESSTTTKLRVVFDASAKTSTGISLNDNLLVGPVLQQDLTSILIRWRYWLVPLSADIKQMYLYIEVAPDHRDYLRILWRDSESQFIRTYRLKKVTFGTASAPYQAIKTLMRLATDHENEYPDAAKILKRDFYVDDCLTGANNTADAISLQQQLVALTSKANFTLRKWSSSDRKVVDAIPEDMREATPLSFDKDEEITKALGLIWTPTKDEFRFSVKPCEPPATTKRRILSEIAKVFDPLGYLSPVTIRAKMLMQQLWKCESGWDAQVPKDLLNLWNSYQSDIQGLTNLRIPRCINMCRTRVYQLHGFSDASEKAYAAVVYLRALTERTCQTRLIISKTRVAPTKGETIPRLELCGAVLLSQLMTTVSTALDVVDAEQFAWTDSTITLAWIQSETNNWKTFVRNRVITIQSHIPASRWQHVPGTLNPADLPSRGITAQELQHSKLWWNGPEFLHTVIPNPKPSSSNDITLSSSQRNFLDNERKTETPRVFVANSDPSMIDLNKSFARYSSWLLLRRHTVWWIRLWKWHLKKTIPTRAITPEELCSAENSIAFFVQRQLYATEISALETNQVLPKKSPLLSLSPFIQDGLLRVGGRLSKAALKYDNRHQILMPRHHVTDLIFRFYHFYLKHAGPSLLCSMVQRRFWVIRAKSEARKIVNRCKQCRIQMARSPIQLMADLPESRVTMSEPFTNAGVDYAGPISIAESTLRKTRHHKAYIAVFVCLCTKAVTLELVSDLTTETFIAAFERFSSRRRRPSSIKSDNGTTFVGAARELEELYQFLSADDFTKEVIPYMADHGTKWTFIPPAAPHMGGLWEAAVKAAKFHIKRVIGKAILTFEQYDTLLKQVEACLNSRPLCASSSDPNDLTPLTPGHFLTGYPPAAFPEQDVRHIKVNRLNRWQLLQSMKQHFWDRWQSEYLQQLQRRTKWKSAERNVKVGDLAVIRDEQQPPQFWKMARVEEVHPNPNDDKQLVRTVTVRTASGVYTRPITKLVLLPNPEDEE